MKIEYLGHSCFYIVGKEMSVVTDPHQGIGYGLKCVTADYCTLSHAHFDHANVSGVNAREVITSSKDGFIAIDSYHDSNLGKIRGKNTIFKFTVDGVVFCHMGDLGEYFSSSLVEEIGEVDCLFIPIGGKYTIDYKEAIKYIQAIKPKIAIPMHYKTDKSSLDIDGIDNFKKHIAMIENVSKIIEIQKDELPEEESVYIFDSKEF